jgi:taspase (threonine aspartase 1)
MFVAVHIGCGTYNGGNNKKYGDLMKYACRVAMRILENNGNAKEAVKMAISVLEDSELTNSGYGSNLTKQGTVECDASIMCGQSGSWCGVGATIGVKNPIQLANHMMQSRSLGTYSLGRIRPMFDITPNNCIVCWWGTGHIYMPKKMINFVLTP